MPCLGRHCKLKHVLALLSWSISAWVSADVGWWASSYCVKLYRNKSFPCQTRSSGFKSLLGFMIVALSGLLNVTFGCCCCCCCLHCAIWKDFHRTVRPWEMTATVFSYDMQASGTGGHISRWDYTKCLFSLLYHFYDLKQRHRCSSPTV